MDGELAKRRAAAEAALEQKKRKQADERELRAVVMLETEARFVDELGGARGEAFEIVDGGAEGPIVMKLGPLVLFKEFRAKVDDPKGKGITIEACQRFVRPCVVFPTPEEFDTICMRRAGLIFDCANDLHRLYGRNEAEERGK